MQSLPKYLPIGSTPKSSKQNNLLLPNSSIVLNPMLLKPKDIMLLTGRSKRYGRILLNKIKEHFGKKQHQLVCPDVFAEYSGIKIEVIDT